MSILDVFIEEIEQQIVTEFARYHRLFEIKKMCIDDTGTHGIEPGVRTPRLQDLQIGLRIQPELRSCQASDKIQIAANAGYAELLAFQLRAVPDFGLRQQCAWKPI